MKWPLQKDCDAFYGDPRGTGGGASLKWESNNLVRLTPPWQMTYAGKPIKSFRIHKKCLASLGLIFQKIWDAADEDQKIIDKWGMSVFGGTYNYRLIRGSDRLSMHSYGCAIDLDPVRNALNDDTPHFATCPEVLKAFAGEGWEWGGRWSREDGMHFQAARTR